MNIKLERKNAIQALYKQGISIEDLQMVSGLSRKTIEGIVTPKNSLSSLLEEINSAFQVLSVKVMD